MSGFFQRTLYALRLEKTSAMIYNSIVPNIKTWKEFFKNDSKNNSHCSKYYFDRLSKSDSLCRYGFVNITWHILYEQELCNEKDMIIVELSSVCRRQPTVGGADCSGTFGQDLINNLSCIIKVFFSLIADFVILP